MLENEVSIRWFSGNLYNYFLNVSCLMLCLVSHLLGLVQIMTYTRLLHVHQDIKIRGRGRDGENRWRKRKERVVGIHLYKFTVF